MKLLNVTKIANSQDESKIHIEYGSELLSHRLINILKHPNLYSIFIWLELLIYTLELLKASILKHKKINSKKKD